MVKTVSSPENDLSNEVFFSLVQEYEATHSLSYLETIQSANLHYLSSYQAGIKRVNQKVVEAFKNAGEKGVQYLNDVLTGNFSDGHVECAAHIIDELKDQVALPPYTIENLRTRAEKANFSTTEFRLNYVAIKLWDSDRISDFSMK